MITLINKLGIICLIALGNISCSEECMISENETNQMSSFWQTSFLKSRIYTAVNRDTLLINFENDDIESFLENSIKYPFAYYFSVESEIPECFVFIYIRIIKNEKVVYEIRYKQEDIVKNRLEFSSNPKLMACINYLIHNSSLDFYLDCTSILANNVPESDSRAFHGDVIELLVDYTIDMSKGLNEKESRSITTMKFLESINRKHYNNVEYANIVKNLIQIVDDEIEGDITN